jgi:hypothetical protein
MIVKRLSVALMGLCLAVNLGACSSVAGTTSDLWPHWAGGEPKGLPPRPGTPGYDDYIAHRQATGEPAQPAAANNQPAAPATAAAAPAATEPEPPPENDTAVARGGGLY